jgi:hypothetical protein
LSGFYTGAILIGLKLRLFCGLRLPCGRTQGFEGGRFMHKAGATVVIAVAVVIGGLAGAAAQDAAKYPDWSGHWRGIRNTQWDPTKPAGLAQQAPLTPEYQAVFEASLADQKAGGQGNNLRWTCQPSGMPRTMTALFQLEFVIMPKTTYVLFATNNPTRRIYTDGRNWPTNEEPSAVGYSIGKWLDTDGDGRYDTLEVETRNIGGHRTYDNTGLPLAFNDSTIVYERIYGDKSDPGKIYDEITTVDDGLTRPWTVTKAYFREKDDRWVDVPCGQDNHHLLVGDQYYFVSGDGYLMPTKKGQAPPDARYFTPARVPGSK